MSIPGCATLSVVLLCSEELNIFLKFLFPCLVLGNYIEPLEIWHQEKSSIQILPWFIFLPFSTAFGSYMFTQQPVGKYVQFFILDD